MSHLGERVATLVDGQLDTQETERALIHIAGCRRCRHEVEVERLTKTRLAAMGCPALGGDLIHRLLDLAGPAGPLPPRPGHVPGSPRPQFTSMSGLVGAGSAKEASRPAGPAVTRPAGRGRGSSRPPLVRTVTVSRVVRSSRTRVAAAMVGAVCLVGAGVTSGVANSGVADQQRVVPPVDSFVLEHSVTTSSLPFGDQTVLWGAVGAGR